MKDPSISNSQPNHALYVNSRIRKNRGYGIFDEGNKCRVEIETGKCRSREDTSKANTLAVNSGHILFNDEKIKFNPQKIDIDSGHDKHPRKDVVYIEKKPNNPPTAKVSKGKPEPKDPNNATHENTIRPTPDAFAGKDVIVLAEVWVNKRAQSISANDVLDRRVSSEVNYGKVHTDELDVGSGLNINGNTYIQEDEVEPIMVMNGLGEDAASTTATSYTATTFKIHLKWDNLPSVNTVCSVSFQASPGANETLKHNVKNMQDRELVSGTEYTTGKSEPVHTNWDDYSPTTHSDPITLTSQIKTSHGQNGSEIKNAALWLGKRI
ncbi:hypothetical protein [Halorubrum sp. Eb13]|uniref:hypothetical protein n=1 Tax=Halorubrum sp. Eb13 TaxID=1383843 RepID=UPI001140698B|nr:hypothetical protein [Halorubrum sp. Eb13]